MGINRYVNPIIPYVRLARVDHGLMAVLAALAAYLYVSQTYSLATILALAVATLSSEIYLFATNDIFNLEEDKVNRPNAPLIRGEVSVRAAWLMALSSLVVGLLLTVFLGFECLAIYLLANSLGTAYNVKLKRVPLVGNSLVAITTSLTFPFGAAAGGSPFDAVVMSMFLVSLLANLGREVAKCVRDLEGDLRAGFKTVAHLLGVRGASSLSIALVISAIAASTLILAYSNSMILRASVILTDALLAYEAVRYFTRLDAEVFRVGSLRAFSITLVGFLLCGILNHNVMGTSD